MPPVVRRSKTGMKIKKQSKLVTRLLQGSVVCVAVGAFGAGRNPALGTPTQRKWERRAYLCADNLQAARHLINESVLALQTRWVTKGFEQALAEKPHDFIRRVNFIHAASEVLSCSFPVRENLSQWPVVSSDKPVYDKAVTLISKYATKVNSAMYHVPYWHIKAEVNSPDLIVAAFNLVPFGEILLDKPVGKIAVQDAQRATTLDPTFAEAWFVRGKDEPETETNRRQKLSTQVQTMWIKAGKLDSTLAPFIYYARAMTEFNNPKQQHKDLAEYIKLFPNDPWRNILCTMMKCPDLKKLPVNPQMPDVADLR